MEPSASSHYRCFSKNNQYCFTNIASWLRCVAEWNFPNNAPFQPPSKPTGPGRNGPCKPLGFLGSRVSPTSSSSCLRLSCWGRNCSHRCRICYFSEKGEVIFLFAGYKLDTKLEFGEHKDYTKDYPGLPKDYPSLSKDYPSLSKDYPSLSKEYPGLSKDYASLPKEYLSKDYAKDYMAGGLMKASEYHKLGAGPLHHGDYKPYSDLSLSKPSLGDYKPGRTVSPSLKYQKCGCS